jgi:hypothetical protein
MQRSDGIKKICRERFDRFMICHHHRVVLISPVHSLNHNLRHGFRPASLYLPLFDVRDHEDGVLRGALAGVDASNDDVAIDGGGFREPSGYLSRGFPHPGKQQEAGIDASYVFINVTSPRFT